MTHIKAVKFTGSTTMVAAINHWIKTDIYKKPQVVTRDIRFSFQTEVGNMTVNNGDYVVKDVQSGTFSVMSAEKFQQTYGWTE